MITVRINDYELKVPEGTTILEASKKIHIEIPTLCKHPDLEATGACGICIVRVKGLSAPVRSCTTILKDGMEISTHDPDIVSIRRNILELILSTHPNECLTCGRNGTCELQKLAEKFSIRRDTLPTIITDAEIDDSTKSIVLDPRKCIKCGRCINVCQAKQKVWALSFHNRGIETRITPAGDISMSESPCVRCGQCSAHCPVGAIIEYDETQKIWKALADPDIYCIAQIAPAVRVSLGEAFGYPTGTNLTGQLYDALRRIGFNTVFDTNFGADVTIMEEATEFVQRLKNEPGKLPLITTCCPSWVDFMEKFYPDMITYFSSCKSPHSIVGTLAKTYYAKKQGIDPKKIFMVSIMPCTSKKYEITRSESMFASGIQDVDISITTRELIRIIQQSGTVFSELDFLAEPDSPLGEYSGAGLIFGTSGGVLEAALRTASYLLTGKPSEHLEFNQIRGPEGIKEMEVEIGERKIRIAAVNGLGNVEKTLSKTIKAINNNDEPPYHFIEIMACTGGCIGGGGQAWNVDDEKRKLRSEGLFKEDGFKSVRCSHQNPYIKKLYDEFLEKPHSEKAQALLHTKYTKRSKYDH